MMKQNAKRLSLALFALPVLLTSGSTIAAEKFRDWTVSCNEKTLYCIGRSEGVSAAGDKLKFKLERTNKPNSRIFVSSGPEHPLEEGMRVDIDVLGRDFGVFGDIKKIYDGNEMAFREKPENRILKEMRLGRKAQVTIKFGGDIGTIVYDVSLSGVASVLAYMDQIQGRMDRVDAAIIVGGEPAESNSKAPSKPIAAKPAEPAPSREVTSARPAPEPNYEVSPVGAARLAYSAEDLGDAFAMHGYRVFNCEFPDMLQGYGAGVIQMTPTKQIATVPCKPGDVNIEHYVAILSNGQNISEIYDFELPIDFNAPNDQTLINPSWDSDSQRLTSVTYYSPNSDCGEFRSYRFDEEQNFFELMEYREKQNCDGQFTSPETYPISWTIDEIGG